MDKNCGKWNEYIGVHTNDFLVANTTPQEIINKFKKVYTIKDSGPLKYMLGFDIHRKSNFWTFGSKTYVKQAIERVEKLFGTIKKDRIPMVKGDHPEQDQFPLLGALDIEFYHMLIGMARWIVHLGRMDIMFALGCLDRFNAGPREGHFDRVLKIFGY